MDAIVRKYHKIGRWSTGRVSSVRLGPRDFDYLYALFIHDTLPSHILHALVAPKTPQYVTTNRMFLFKNAPNLLISQPEDQEFAMNANYTNLSYQLTDAGAQALVDAGRVSFEAYQLWTKRPRNHHYDHAVATGFITASIELGARAHGVRFLSWLDILTHPKCPQETRDAKNPLAFSYEFDGEKRFVVPDQAFGLEYPDKFSFFMVETDMGTEQQQDNSKKHSTIASKFRGYEKVIKSKSYKSHLGISSMQVLFVPPSIVRVHNAMKEISGPTRPFLFQAVPEFARRTREKLPADGRMFTTAYKRAGHPDFSLVTGTDVEPKERAQP